MVASVGPVAQSPLAMGSWRCKRVEEVAHRPKRESSTHTPTHDECSGSSPLCAELRFNGHCAPREWCKCGEVGRCTLVPGVCLRLSQKCVGDGARGVLAMACPSSATPTPTSTLHPTSPDRPPHLRLQPTPGRAVHACPWGVAHLERVKGEVVRRSMSQARHAAIRIHE